MLSALPQPNLPSFNLTPPLNLEFLAEDEREWLKAQLIFYDKISGNREFIYYPNGSNIPVQRFFSKNPLEILDYNAVAKAKQSIKELEMVYD